MRRKERPNISVILFSVLIFTLLIFSPVFADFPQNISIPRGGIVSPVDLPGGLTIPVSVSTSMSGTVRLISPSNIIQTVLVQVGSPVQANFNEVGAYNVTEIYALNISAALLGISETFAGMRTGTYNNTSPGIKTLSVTSSIGSFSASLPPGNIAVQSIQPSTISPGQSVTANLRVKDAGIKAGEALADSVTVTAVWNVNLTIGGGAPPPTLTITASAGSGGTIIPSGLITVNRGTDQSFTITPSAGYRIADVKVDGSSVGARDLYTFTNVTANHTIEASFTLSEPQVTHTITATAGSGGAIRPSGKVTVNHGADQTFAITPSAGFHIADVIVDGASVGAVDTYTFPGVTSDHTVDASFAINTYTITATANNGGMISPSGLVTVNHGANQTFTVTPSAGFRIADVKVDGASVGAKNTYTFPGVASDHTIDASFAAITYKITATAGIGGVISPSGLVIVNHGTDQTFTVTPSEGSHLTDVKVDGSSIGAEETYTFTNVTSDHTIDASFAINSYTIKATAGDGGTIIPSGSITVSHGASQTFTMAPSVGYRVVGIKVDGASSGIANSYTFEDVVSDHTIDVSFAINTYIITATAGDGGTIAPSGFTPLTRGSNQTFTVTPGAGYHVADVRVNGISVGRTSTYTFINVTSDYKIEAIFAINTYTITSAAGNGGTIGPSGSITVVHGTNQTFTITSRAGYRVADVKVDGVSIGSATTYTFANVIADHTIEASFGVKGDVNSDGLIRSDDALLALFFAVELRAPTDYQKWATDMNEDGRIRSDDALLILRKAAGLAAPIAEARDTMPDRQITIALGGAHGAAGESVTVPLKVDNTAVLACGDICIAYDQSVLRAVDVSSDTGVLLASNVSEPGMIHIVFASTDKLNSRVLADIRFDVIVDGVSPLKIKSAELYGFDALPLNSRCIDKEFRSWAVPAKRSALLQNFPNPFNPDTWMPYQLKEACDVTIRIFSAGGEFVRELRLGHKPAGLYINRERAAYWDGKNEVGEEVASGVYFYSIRAGSFSETRKMVIVK